MVIMETRRVRHELKYDSMTDLENHLKSEIERAWYDNRPCGQMELSWEENSVRAVVKDGDMVLSDTQYTLVKKDEYPDKEGVLE